MDVESTRTNLGTPAGAAGRMSLLQMAQSGDRLAFQQLVEQHQARVFGVALRLMGRHADADEIAQDVFLQLHGSLVRIESPAHLVHWLLRTVVRSGYVLGLQTPDGPACTRESVDCGSAAANRVCAAADDGECASRSAG
jgi:hypothetical protein